MALMELRLIVEVEDKETWEAPAGVSAQEVVQHLQDVLRDVTKHDETTSWMVRRVRPAD